MMKKQWITIMFILLATMANASIEQKCYIDEFDGVSCPSMTDSYVNVDPVATESQAEYYLIDLDGYCQCLISKNDVDYALGGYETIKYYKSPLDNGACFILTLLLSYGFYSYQKVNRKIEK